MTTADPTPLWLGPMHWFSDWPVGDVPQVGSLVYTIWDRSDAFVYVGISGRSVTQSARAKGPLGRLNSHASGRRSGDQFLIYDIFAKSDYSSAWCNANKSFSMTFAAANKDTTASFNFYPAIQASQKGLSFGKYQDTMTLTTVTPGANASTTFLLNGNVPGACTLSTTNLAFGTYAGANLNSTATVTVNCSNTAPYEVSLDAGSNSNGTTRRMISGGGQYLTYALYSDSGYTTTWGNGTSYGNVVSGTGTGSNQSLTVYGRVPASQSPLPGSFSDTVVVTLSY